MAFGSTGGPSGGGGPSGRTLVVGHGANTNRSSVPDVGQPETMDSPSRNPTHPMLLEDALKKNPSLKGQFIDVFVERIGVNPSPPPGLTTGLTPAGVASARDLLKPGGTLRILQEPAPGQAPVLESDIRNMLFQDFTNIGVVQWLEKGVPHLLVTATRK